MIGGHRDTVILMTDCDKNGMMTVPPEPKSDDGGGLY